MIKSKRIFAVACSIVLLVVFNANALFYSNYDFTINAQGGDTGLISLWSFTSTQQSGFKNPGDTVSGDITVQNNGTNPVSYEFRLQLSNNTGLENATLIYIDDVLVGNLGYLCSNSSSGANVYKLPSYTLYKNDTYSHTIKLEYHIGASSYYQGKAFTLQVGCYAKQILNTDGITYVNSWDELKQMANAQLAGKNSGEIIKLSDNISSDNSGDITFTQPLTLDLNGKALTLNKNIIFAGAGKSFLTNGRPASGGVTGIGKVIMNNSNGILVPDTALVSSANIYSFSSSLLEQSLSDYINSQLKNGITDSTNILGGYFLYNSYLSIAMDSTQITDGVVPASRANSTIVKKLHISVNSRPQVTIEFQVIGNDDSSILTAILNGPLSSINSLNSVDSSILLPIRLKEYNCQISWWSSNEQVLSSVGEYTKPINNVPVSLIAIISFNGMTYTHEFSLVAAGYTNTEKLQYLCSQYGDILFSTIGQIKNLPTADNYKQYTGNVDLGITNLSYSYDTGYTFLNLNGNSSLQLIDDTDVTSLQLTVTATFSGGSPSTANGVIDVSISLSGGSDVNPIFVYVQGTLPKDAADNNFPLPGEYENATISYYIPNNISGDKLSSDMVDATTEVVNSTDAYNISSIVSDTTGTYYKPDFSKAPPKNTLVNIIVQVSVSGTGGTNTYRRQMSFTVGGAVHGDLNNKFNSTATVQDKDLFNALKNLILTSLSTTDRANRTYIKLSEIANTAYSTLTLNNALLQSIQGLQYFPKLTTLNLAGSAGNLNTFSDISPLSNLIGLTYVNLSYSNVTNVSPLKNITATPTGGITLIFDYNTQLSDITPLVNLYVGKASLTGTSCTYQLGAYTIFKWMKAVHLSIKNTYNSFYNTSDVVDLIQSGSTKEEDAFPIADSLYLPTMFYDTMIMPANLNFTKTSDINNLSYEWTVITGKGSQYLSITNPTGAATVAVTSRPTTDTTVIFVLYVAAANNLTNFKLPRAFFVTLKGTS